MHFLKSFRTLAIPPLMFASIGLSIAHAEDAAQNWQVGRASGEVWLVTAGAQPVSLANETALKAGDSVRTGRSGRVLLRRGEETILISPNSVVGLPSEQKPGSTTIIQQAGSILLEVNKRDERSFQVETPYLVAAVKGTQFRVSVGHDKSDVVVQHGSVEVADAKTGKFALVLPGQSATVSGFGAGSFSLHGTGTLSPIQNGPPRATSIGRVPVPRGGLTAPSSIRSGLQVRPVGNAVAVRATGGGLRIAAPIGQVRLDIHSATKGLAVSVDGASSASSKRAATIWNPNGASVTEAAAAASSSAVTATAVSAVSAPALSTIGISPTINPAIIGGPARGRDSAAMPGLGNGPSNGLGVGNAPGAGNVPRPGNGISIGIGPGGIGGGLVGVGPGGIVVNVGPGNSGNGGGNGGGNGNGNNGHGGGNGNGNNGNGNGNGGGNGSNGSGLALGRNR